MHVISPLDRCIRPFSSGPERLLLRRSTSDSHLLEVSKSTSRSGITSTNTNKCAMNSYNLTPIKQRQQHCAACSKSIPIPSKGLRRTPSELQLLQDEATADYQDYCMYARIVNGIHSRGGRGDNPKSLANAVANIHSVQNIIRTRHLPVPEDISFAIQHCDDESFRREWQVLCSSFGGNVVDREDQEGIFILDM